MKKKILSIILMLAMCFSLCACGNKDIELTKDNYSDYLEISAKSVTESNSDIAKLYLPGGGISSCSNVFYLKCDVKGVSQNYNYNDVKVTVKVKATYEGIVWSTKETELREFEKEFTINTNISGNMKEDCISKEMIKLDDYIVNGELLKNIEYEVVSISGTLSPVN